MGCHQGAHAAIAGVGLALLHGWSGPRLVLRGDSAYLRIVVADSDLDEVPFIDEVGLALLQGWSGPQLQLRGGSPYLRAWLATEGLESGNSTPTGTATTATTNRR